MRFAVKTIEQVDLAGPEQLLGSDLMSPFVWRTQGGELGLLVRAVPCASEGGAITGSIWYGVGDPDGLHFAMDSMPLLTPGPGDLDILGCEDPTFVPANDSCVMYYTGLDAQGAGQMLCASGPNIHALEKKGVALASSKTERNTKEASVEVTKDGQWRLFYEYARDWRSRVGLAFGSGPFGPWNEQPDPFAVRPDHWDNWHLSTGPLLMTDPNAPVMFYNGSDRNARWGIGWIVFARDCASVIERCETPLIAPSEAGDRGREISFSASVLQGDGEIFLYFSRNDRWLFRATIEKSD